MKGKYKIHRNYYCDTCDKDHVTNGTKCGTCGVSYKSRGKEKKPTQGEIRNNFEKYQ